MWRKVLVIAVAAALGVSGCAQSRAKVRGQNPENRPVPASATASAPPRTARISRSGANGEVDWWADPRLAQVKNRAEGQSRRRKALLVPAVAAMFAAWLFLPDLADASMGLGPWPWGSGSSNGNQKVVSGGGGEKQEPKKEKERAKP